jgi:EAL and modified HD-GYP domain-containing signal transduction protein
VFQKFVEAFGGKSRAKQPEPPAPVHAADRLGKMVSLVENDQCRAAAADDSIIDTRAVAPKGNVTSILDIETHGTRTDAAQLPLRFLGRQPVLDGNQQLIGYELMLRNRGARQQSADDALLRMQDEMLLRSILGLEIEQLLGDKIAFIGFSVFMLDDPLLDLLPRTGLVLAFQPVSEYAAWMADRLKQIAASGFQIALDDFIYTPELKPLLSFVSYVRVDVGKCNAMQLGEQVAQVQKHPGVVLLAKNVQTDEDFEACRRLGFQQYQGYFFTRMQPALPPRLNSDRVRVMELLNLVTTHADISALEEVFKRDATLSYKLLRYINSPGCGLPQQLRSIAHALVMLGHDQLYRWLTLLLFTSGKLDMRSQALLKNAMVRARLTERLGRKKVAQELQEGLFIAGIFSLLDVLLNLPMEQALAQLNLPEPLLAALIRKEGPYAPYLELAVACEEWEQDKMAELAAACGLDVQEVNLAHVQAMIWAESMDK